MDPWGSCQRAVTTSHIPTSQKFEDNFIPRLPDSEEYLAVLEAKLNKIKNDPDVLRQLAAKREACMEQLLCGDIQLYEDQNSEVLNAPVLQSSQLVRSILPQKQALNQGEIVELVKYDQLSNDDSDLDLTTRECEEENRSP